jgi:hypothetical protein
MTEDGGFEVLWPDGFFNDRLDLLI